MSLIEQAAQRLEQLRQAGVDVPSKSADESTRLNEQKIDKELEAETVQNAVTEKSAPVGLETHSSRRIDLDLNALSAAGFIRPDAPRSQLADEYRVVKRPLIDNAMGRGATRIKDGNLIMVTSALPGEGKTFTAANLAMSIAMELDNTVMLVDADVARPTLLSRLGLPPMRGLLDVLVDDSIVRGTTSAQIVDMAREAGAEKVYFASAAPEIRFPNVYGIDMPVACDLIAYGREVNEICQLIRADGLIFQDLSDLEAALRECNPEIKQFETSVFNGKYITGDINDDYLAFLNNLRNDDAKADREWSEATADLELYNGEN